MTSATDCIRAQHRDFALVLETLEELVDGPIEERRDEDVARLYDVRHYLRVFPDKIHHPAEERHLFGPLRAAAPEHADLLAHVQTQHAHCDTLTAQLYDAVQAFDWGEQDAPALRRAVRSYLDFQFEHMRTEEQDILPLVDATLDGTQLDAAAVAFAQHADPMLGENLVLGFEALKRRIVGERAAS